MDGRTTRARERERASLGRKSKRKRGRRKWRRRRMRRRKRWRRGIVNTNGLQPVQCCINRAQDPGRFLKLQGAFQIYTKAPRRTATATATTVAVWSRFIRTKHILINSSFFTLHLYRVSHNSQSCFQRLNFQGIQLFFTEDVEALILNYFVCVCMCVCEDKKISEKIKILTS